MTQGDQVSGQFNGSLDFDGSGDFIRISEDETIEPSAITISYWVKRDGAQIQYAKHLYKTWQNDSGPTFQSYGFEHSTDSQIGFYIGKSGGYAVVQSTANALPDNTWVHVVGTYNPSASAPQQKLYINGEIDNSTTNTDTILYDNGLDADLYFAVEKPSSPTYRFDGSLDELRISNNARSAGWIWTEHNNQKLNLTFFDVEGEENLTHQRQITIDHTKVACTSDISSFPMLISIQGDPDLRYTDHGGKVKIRTETTSSLWPRMERPSFPMRLKNMRVVLAVQRLWPG